MKFLSAVVCLLALFAASTSIAQVRRPPNVVLILADDLGWADTTLYRKHELHETPNIARLASRGMRFVSAYAAPVCSPSRNCVMTGLSTARTGMFKAAGGVQEVILESTLPGRAPRYQPLRLPISTTRMNPLHTTLAQSLKKAGYVTGHFGKWHLGRGEVSTPQTSGFDVNFPGTHNASPPGGYFKWATRREDLQRPEYEGVHADDAVASEAIKFLRANRGRPFFLNLWAFSVHSPFEAKPALVERYRRKAKQIGSSKSPTYAAMVRTLDQNVGRVLDAIDRLKLANDTIILFASDNGGVVHETVDGAPATTNAPLRSGKGTLWEGGIRVPFVVVWPGTVEAGSVNEQIVQCEDIYPTILEMVGANPPSDQIFDGVSIVPALRGERLSREAVFNFFPSDSGSVIDKTDPGISVRVGDMKLIRFFHANADRSHRYELYDLARDLGETNDLSQERPEVVQSMDARIEAFLDETQAVVPVPNARYVAPSP